MASMVEVVHYCSRESIYSAPHALRLPVETPGRGPYIGPLRLTLDYDLASQELKGKPLILAPLREEGMSQNDSKGPGEVAPCQVDD